jgi:hypothetical protein
VAFLFALCLGGTLASTVLPTTISSNTTYTAAGNP